MIRFLLLVVVSGAAFAQTPPLPSPEEASRATDQQTLETVSPAQYRDRLIAMQQLVATCREAISVDHCDGAAVGGDVRVSLNAGARTVRFGWLRELLEEAGRYDPAKNQPAPAKPNLPAPLPGSAPSPTGPAKASPAHEPLAGSKLPPAPPHDELEDADAAASIPTRLDQAKDRLKDDLNRLADAAAAKPDSAGPTAADRKALTAILAGNEFHAATVGRTLKDRVLEKIAGWINRAINKLVSVGAKSKWIGVTAEIGFVLALCVGLVWFLIRLEKRGHFGPALFSARAASGAPSERDWQLLAQGCEARGGFGRVARSDSFSVLGQYFQDGIRRFVERGPCPNAARVPGPAVGIDHTAR